MNPVAIFDSLRPDQSILVLSAHCDDAEIGCGGLLLRLARHFGDRCPRKGIVFSGGDQEERKREQLAAARAFGLQDVAVHAYPDTLLPNHWHDIKDDLLAFREELGSDGLGLVLCPRLDDRHQDHQVVAENAWRVFRDHIILEYELPKYEGDLAHPNVYVKLTEAEAGQKVNSLMECYPSRSFHHWWSRDTFMALMCLRGIEANVGWAEGFFARKILV